MKKLVLSAVLALSFLAVPAPQANAGGFGFSANVSVGVNFSCTWSGCGSCYGGGFAPAYCGMGGYPGYPGVSYGYPAADYGYCAPAYGAYPQAAPAYAPQMAAPQAQQVGYYPQAGYGNYAMPAYWYGR